jgi:taurine dioxygenase
MNVGIEVRPVTPVIGAEIRGVDLSQPLSDAEFTAIHQAFLDHQVLFFKDQRQLTPERQIEFGRRFGPLHFHPAAPHLDGHPEIFVIHVNKNSKHAAGEVWHSDVSCDAEPPLATILQIHLLPLTGGDTMFASMYAAYDELSAPMKSFLEGLKARHESEHYYRGRYGNDDSEKIYPANEHPVIRTHPETGRRALFVNEMFTRAIVGLEPAESKAVLAFLFEHIRNPYYQVRFRWELNDIAMWDNRSAQHMAIWDYWPNERKGHRVTVKGDRPR